METVKNTTLQIRMTRQEREAISRLAKQECKKTPSEWAREKLLASTFGRV